MRYLFYSVILLFLFNAVSAQQYPYKQGFETTLSGQVPSGFVGDITVLSYHGMNDLKGLAALLYSGDSQDTTITPLIGPLTQGSILVFYYRWVRDNIYPSEPKMPVNGDKLEVQLTEDDSIFTTIHLIDSAAHKPNLNFKRIQVQLGSYAGKNVRFQFRCIRGSDRYFMDIDSISVQNQGGFNSIEETTENKMRVYPNPCRDYFVIDKEKCNDNFELSITDVSGKTVLKSSTACMQSVNVSSLSNGLYFIQSNDGKSYGRQKLMIQR